MLQKSILHYQLKSSICLQTSLIMEPLYLLFYEFVSAAAILKVRIWTQITANLWLHLYTLRNISV